MGGKVRIIIMSKILMKIRLSMNEEYEDHTVIYIVGVTSIDKAGFHGYYTLDHEAWNCNNGIGLFRWEHIGHTEKIK